MRPTPHQIEQDRKRAMLHGFVMGFVTLLSMQTVTLIVVILIGGVEW